jgi:hypothetical protein
MKNISSVLFFIVSFVMVQANVGAVALQKTLPDYSAEEHMETEQGEMVTRIFHSGQKERREMVTNGSNMITIMRMDKKIVWMLMPEQKMYMENKLDEGDKSHEDKHMAYTMENENLGEEVINGIKTTKRKSVFTTSDGKKLGGFVWVSKEGIPVKQQSVAKSGDTKIHMKSELKNLVVKKQDSKLFELPVDYQPMSMGAMMMQGGLRKHKSDSEDVKKGEGLNLKDISKLF